MAIELSSYTIYSVTGLQELGAEDFASANAVLGMEAAVVRKRTENAPMPATRGTARGIASAILLRMLGSDDVDRLELDADHTGPSRRPWLAPSRFAVRLPPDGPDPDMPCGKDHVVSSALAACRAAYAAADHFDNKIPSDADRFRYEALAIRYLLNSESATAESGKLPGMGLGMDGDAFRAAVLRAERARTASGALEPLTTPPGSLDDLLVVLDSAEALAAQKDDHVTERRVTKPRPDFLAGGKPISMDDLPAVTAHLSAYARPAPVKIVNVPGQPSCAVESGDGYAIRTGFPAGQGPAPDGLVQEAMALAFEIPEARLAALSIDGRALPEDPDRTDEENAWLEKIESRPDDGTVMAGVHFFAAVRLIAALSVDPGMSARDLLEPAARAALDRFVRLRDAGRIPWRPDPDGLDGWTDQCMAAVTDGAAPDAPDPGAALAARWTAPALRVRLKAGTEPVPRPDAPWRSPGYKAFGRRWLACGDLPDMAVRLGLEALQDSPALDHVGVLAAVRNVPYSTVDGEDMLAVRIAVGWPAPDGTPRPAADDADLADEPAPEALIFQVALSAFEAARRAEQACMALGKLPVAPKLAEFLDGPETPLSILNLGMDAKVEGLRRASAFFKRHPEFKDLYGFDFESVAAAWTNAAVLAGNLVNPGKKALTAEDTAVLLEALSARLPKTMPR